MKRDDLKMVLRWVSTAAAVSAVILLHAQPAAAQVSITTLNTAYTQNFDTLPPSGSATWTNNSTIPGWYHARTGTGATIVANDGSSNAGNLYSYGTGAATDRAFGSLGSGNVGIGNIFWGVRLQNNSGAAITSLDVSYTGEQWRNSASTAQTVAFSYLVGLPTVAGSLAEFQSAGVPVTGLDFTGPITAGTPGALNGNLAANRVSITFSITGLNVPNGAEIMLRWSDPDHTGADHGIGIDDFSVIPMASSAAAAAISGRVTTSDGRGVSNAILTIAGGGMPEPRTISTGPFGYYVFEGMQAGQSYSLTISGAKRFTFTNPTRIVNLQDDVTDANFIAEP
jgi:Carboxypeptidase regulatory-like domain